MVYILNFPTSISYNNWTGFSEHNYQIW